MKRNLQHSELLQWDEVCLLLGEPLPGLFFYSPVSTLGNFSEFWPPVAYFVDSSFKEICAEYFPLKSVEKRSYTEVLMSAIALHFYVEVSKK